MPVWHPDSRGFFLQGGDSDIIQVNYYLWGIFLGGWRGSFSTKWHQKLLWSWCCLFTKEPPFSKELDKLVNFCGPLNMPQSSSIVSYRGKTPMLSPGARIAKHATASNQALTKSLLMEQNQQVQQHQRQIREPQLRQPGKYPLM